MNKIISKISIWAIWVLIVILTFSLIKNLGRVKQGNQALNEEKDRIEKIKKDNESLKNQITKSKSPEFIEKEVRDKLGLVKPGEAIVVLPDEQILKSLAPQDTTEPDTLPDPTWKRWLKLFTS